MDLRVVKTKKVIREAFLSLRQHYPLEKVKVTDICRIALINKSTFYKYYVDVYALSEELEEEAIQNFWDGFTEKDCLIYDPKQFFKGLQNNVQANLDALLPLYQDRFSIFFTKMEKKLKEYYTGFARSEEEEIQLSFLIIGTLHTFQNYRNSQKFTAEIIEESLAHIIENIFCVGRKPLSESEENKMLNDQQTERRS
ncbi:MAG: hypothetical protein LUE12_01925 [Ruminococcus sp.]|nr:hypothetical protein [Ruminococcus sp.]